MAIWFAEGNMQGREALLYADTKSDVENDLEQFAEDNHLKRGSKCFCIEDHSVVLMNSDGEWK
jgi:hypothetical protein